MARTGYIITVYQDINPSSPTFNTVREERTLDSENCPTSASSNWIEYTRYCEMNERGMYSGYEIIIYMDVEPLSPTYNQTREERVQNTTDCPEDAATANWQNIGEPFCRQMIYMPGGLLGNDGYIVQQQQDMNEYSETADQIRDIATQDLEDCPLPNTEPVWDIISESCHIALYDGELVYDGTKDVTRVNTNQYSPTWNNNIPETANIPDPINCRTIVIPFPNQYLTIESLENNNEIGITPPIPTSFSGDYPFYYSTDNGTTWSIFNEVCNVNYPTVFATINRGQKLLLKADRPRYGDPQNKFVFYTSKTCNIYGNIMSMLTSVNFENRQNTYYEGQFRGFFQECMVVSAKNLVLPTILSGNDFASMFNGCTSLTNAPVLAATTMEYACYSNMFYGCTSLVTAPELPATTLARYCYSGIFRGCSSLNSITCLATDITAVDCTHNWVNGVAASGTFTKASSMSSWTTGVNGIPSGWTVTDA